MCTLNGEVVSGGWIEVRPNDDNTYEIVVRCTGSFSASQISACSVSCNNSTDMVATDNGVTYTGQCNKVCINSCSSNACLTQCTIS